MQLDKSCRLRHENVQNWRKNVMLCTTCEDYCEVDTEQQCSCCGSHVKRIDTKNKTIKKFNTAVEETMPLIRAWRATKPKIRIVIPIEIGVAIRNVDLKWIDLFIKTDPDEHVNFINHVKKNTEIVALRGF